MVVVRRGIRRGGLVSQRSVLMEEYALEAARSGCSLDSIIIGLEDRFDCSSVTADSVAWDAYKSERLGVLE